jgi:hypothetical protein
VGASVDYSLDWVPMMNHTLTLEKQVKQLVIKFIDGLPATALLGQTPAEKREVVCGPANNPRDHETGAIITPEDFYLDIKLAVQSPVLRAHYRIHKKY